MQVNVQTQEQLKVPLTEKEKREAFSNTLHHNIKTHCIKALKAFLYLIIGLSGIIVGFLGFQLIDDIYLICKSNSNICFGPNKRVDWETLVTGILAVLAAFATISYQRLHYLREQADNWHGPLMSFLMNHSQVSCIIELNKMDESADCITFRSMLAKALGETIRPDDTILSRFNFIYGYDKFDEGKKKFLEINAHIDVWHKSYRNQEIPEQYKHELESAYFIIQMYFPFFYVRLFKLVNFFAKYLNKYDYLK